MNVEELLHSKDIQYVPKGADYEVRCLNPEHEDNNPSMRIDRITGIFNCFSCNYRGNLFNLFGEQTDYLQQKRDLLRKKIRNKAIESVGLSFPSDAYAYEGDWRGISPETYRKFEAFQSLQTDFRDRVVFPIRNITGRIVVFQGRHLTGGVPKYLFSPKGGKLPLFPIVKPIKGSIILVEGIFDMLNLHDKGLTNAVCSFGTQAVTVDKLSMLRIQGVDTIHIFFDGDEAGQTAAKEVKELCENAGLLSKNIYWKGKDPGELSYKQVQKIKEKVI